MVAYPHRKVKPDLFIFLKFDKTRRNHYNENRQGTLVPEAPLRRSLWRRTLMLRKNGQRTENALLRHRTALFFFLFLLSYNLVVVRRCAPPDVSIFEYAFYAVDFGMGFVGRFLVGAVFNLFVRTPTPAAATVYMCLLMLLFTAALSLLLERFIEALPERYRNPGLFLLAFYLTGPATFGIYFYQFGMADTHWLFLALPFVLLMQNKKTQFLLPLLFVPMVMINFASLFNWVLFGGLLLLYELTLATEKKDRRRLAALFLAGVALTSGTFLYFEFNEKKNLVYDVETFNEILTDRGVTVLYYLDHTLYGDVISYSPELGAQYAFEDGIEYIDHFPEMEDNLFKATVNRLSYLFRYHRGYYAQNNWYTLKKTAGQMALLTVVLLPMLALFYGVLRAKFKAAKGRFLNRFTYFCMMALYPVSAMAVLPVSSDSVRWLAQGFLVLFSLILYMVYKEKEAVLNILREKTDKIPSPAAALYYGVWFFTVLNPYV